MPGSQNTNGTRGNAKRGGDRFSISEDRSKKGEVYGFDGGKKIKGRKRHIIVDTQGILLAVIVSEANMPERLGALALLLELAGRLPRLALLWVDQGYRGSKFAQAAQRLAGVEIEVVSRQTKEFQVLPRRWVVERTFAWLTQNRRLLTDSELLPEVSECAIYIAMIRLMLRRLTKLRSSPA